MKQKQFVVSHLGSRMHYAVPRLLLHQNMLHSLHTDIWYPHLPKTIQRFLPKTGSRFHKDLEHAKVFSQNLLGFRYANKLSKAKSREEETQAFIWMGKKFCSIIGERLSKESDAIYAFNTAALEIFTHSKSKNKLKVLEQTLVPRAVERTILHEESEIDSFSHLYEQREALEWSLADVIVCASSFVKDALVHQGVKENKIHIVPYGYGMEVTSKPKSQNNQEVRFLFVGNGGARKGLKYLANAWAQVQSHKAHLTICGKLTETEKSWFSSFENVEIKGSVSPTQMPKIYEQNDVFVFPSLCEGSATVIYEALNFGLPVICTPNSGSVVSDLKDGLVIPIRDAEALAASMNVFLSKPSMIEEMSKNALETAANYTVPKYGERLISLLQSF